MSIAMSIDFAFETWAIVLTFLHFAISAPTFRSPFATREVHQTVNLPLLLLLVILSLLLNR